MNEIVALPSWHEPKDLGEAKSAILSLGHSMHENIYFIGQHFRFVKSHVGHRNFLPWLEEHIQAFTPKTAQRYMKFAKECAVEGQLIPYDPTLKNDNLSYLPTPEPPSLPPGKFCLLYADPPWRYEFQESASRSVENHYPTLPFYEIANQTVNGRKVSDLAADDAVLFLWAPPQKLQEANHVMSTWGFTHRTAMCWVKDKIGLGCWFRTRFELLLVGLKGQFPTPKPEDRFDAVLEAPRGRHSEKPIEAIERLEQMYPNLSQTHRIELYARKDRPGWTSWGNEIIAETHTK